MNPDYCIAIACLIGPPLFFLMGWRARSSAYRREWQETVNTREPERPFVLMEQRPSDLWQADGESETLVVDRRTGARRPSIF